MWYKIKDYDGYFINKHGQILSIKRMGNPVDRILKTFTDKDGYIVVSLCKDKKSCQKRLHRLIAETFLDKNNFKYMEWEDKDKIDTNNLVINHKDENPSNNNINNLEWCTVSYNNNYGTRLKKQSVSLSKQIEKYTLENEFICDYPSIQYVCDKFGYSKASISMCCNEKRHKAYGYIWKFKERD